MTIDLPQPIAAYVAADNADDADAIAACFAADAVVRDEGHVHEGRQAIVAWKAAAKRKYQYTSEPLTCITRDGKTVLTNRVTGNFPNSPIDLTFVFTIADGKITQLKIGA
ncbi:MAG: nuclear transport factor 2 family protein [Rhodospirillaceae bacterium]|nr:nuclear transport factor 2 family protein [Rhodospirillaceae bacterium]